MDSFRARRNRGGRASFLKVLAPSHCLGNTHWLCETCYVLREMQLCVGTQDAARHTADVSVFLVCAASCQADLPMGVFPAEPRGLYREAKVDEGGGELPNGCHHHHCHQSSSSPPSVIAIAIVVTVAIAIGHGRRCCTRQASRQAGWQAGVQSAGQEGKNAGPRAIWHASKQAGRPRSVDMCLLPTATVAKERT